MFIPQLAPRENCTRSLVATCPELLSRRKSENREHVVQFYEDESVIVGNAAFLAAKALEAGDSAILLATQTHLKRIMESMASFGHDLHQLRRSHRFWDVDANQALPLIMSAEGPDSAGFHQLIGATVANASRASASGFVFVFGELVDLLCAAGTPVAAIRLEQLWNTLGNQFEFSLYCAYSLDSFGKSPDPDILTEICAEHRLTIPTETPL